MFLGLQTLLGTIIAMRVFRGEDCQFKTSNPSKHSKHGRRASISPSLDLTIFGTGAGLFLIFQDGLRMMVSDFDLFGSYRPANWLLSETSVAESHGLFLVILLIGLLGTYSIGPYLLRSLFSDPPRVNSGRPEQVLP